MPQAMGLCDGGTDIAAVISSTLVFHMSLIQWLMDEEAWEVEEGERARGREGETALGRI